jgi:uncharacterized membrane protein YagU involved in acid resistance
MSEAAKPPKSLLIAILQAGLIAGTLDAIAAIDNFMINTNGANPLKVFRFIASGVLGKEVLEKDLVAMAFLGLQFHFLIAICFAAFFFLVYPKIKILSKNIIVTGLLYGIFVWLVMNKVVLPLSYTSKLPFNLTQMFVGIAILMFAVGLPIALLTKKYYSAGK